MTFTYTTTTSKYYLENSDEFEEYGEDFEYSPDGQDLIDALAYFIARDYFFNNKCELVDRIDFRTVVTKSICNFIIDLEENAIEELLDRYYDDLRDYFRQEAFESIE